MTTFLYMGRTDACSGRADRRDISRRRAAGLPALALSLCCLLAWFGSPFIPPAGGAEAPAYHDQAAVAKTLARLARIGKSAEVSDLATTPGGRELKLLTVRPAGARKDEAATAVLVVGNPLGTTPLATEAALELGRLLASPDKVELPGERARKLTWYIIPAANPDGAARFFASPQVADGRNDQAFDDDKDGRTDEDGPDDLDGNGLITTMLLPHPEGRWLLTADEPRLPKRADPVKGERGLYQMHLEGLDNDADGILNEDGPGGVVAGRNFPHAFEHWTADGGRWAASQPESRAILEFAFDHPEIALVLVFGDVNTLAKVPESDKQSAATGGKYKLPDWMARRAGLDPETEYELDQLVEMARDYTGNKSLTAEDVLSFLDLGAAVNPNRRDLGWWNELSEKYKEFLKEAGLDGERVDPASSVPGSVEEWAYFQYGVPCFALDFWSVPKPQAQQQDEGGDADLPSVDEIEKMSRDEFIALGDEKIAAFLKAHDSPAHITPAMVVQALKGGMMTPARIAEMIRERAEEKEAEGVDPDLKALAELSAEKLDGGGYVAWSEVTLPDGRQALVGGAAPFAMRTPPAAMSDSLLAAQLPFVFELTDWLPAIGIDQVELDYRGADTYELKVYLHNSGRIPYPTAQGKRCRRVPPAAVTVDGVEILEGRGRQTVAEIPALGTASSRWLVRGASGARVKIRAWTASAGSGEKTVVLERKGGLR